MPVLGRGQKRKVDRILVGYLRCERAGKQDVGFRGVLQRDLQVLRALDAALRSRSGYLLAVVELLQSPQH